MDNSAEQYTNIAANHYSSGRYEEALVACNHAIQLDPKCARALHGRGLILAQQKKYKEALEDYQKSSELVPINAKLYSDVGDLFYILKEYEKSYLAYSKAIRLDIKYKPIYRSKAQKLVNNAVSLRNRGLNHESIIAFHQALLFNPEDTQVKNYLSDQQSAFTPKSRTYLSQPYFSEPERSKHYLGMENNQWSFSSSIHPANCRCYECWEP